MNDEIYQESVGSFLNKLINTIILYIDDVKKLHSLYRDKKKLDKGIKFIESLCVHKTIANQKIFVRGYNGKVIEPMNLDNEVQILKNLLTYTETHIKNPVISQYLTNYELYKAGWDTFYKIKIKEIPSLYYQVNSKLENNISELKNILKEISNYFDKADESSHINQLNDVFRNTINKIKESITKDFKIITMNFEAIQYEIGKKFSSLTEETAEKVVRKDISDEAIKKDSTFIKEIKYGDDTYKIYQTIYKNVSAMNYAGSFIYVENGFFDLPKGYQLAILYHEIGHHQCKHFKPNGYKVGEINKEFDIPVEDTEKLVKQIKKDLNKFLFSISMSPFRNDQKYLNGEEFIYLLIEWEADRFSANIVGKRLMKKALSSHFSHMLKSNPYYKDPKKQSMHYKYNMDRMKIRTKNI
jgi:hypothetical protein